LQRRKSEGEIKSMIDVRDVGGRHYAKVPSLKTVFNYLLAPIIGHT